MSFVRGLLLIGLLLLLTTCSSEEGQNAACEGLACGAGACEVVEGRATCRCEPGFHDEGGVCVADVDPLCSPNPCTEPNKTVCSALNGIAHCACDPGFEPDGEGCRVEIPAGCLEEHPGDPFEPDNCAQLARDIGLTGLQDELHGLEIDIDEDWFRIEATEGMLYRVRAFGVAAALLQLDVFAADGLTAVASENRGLVEVDVIAKARQTGPLFVRLKPFTPGVPAHYTIRIEEAGTDDHPDDPESALPLRIGEEIAGALQFYADTEVFRLPLVQGNSYRFDVRWLEPGAGPLRAELIGPDGLSVLRQVDADAPTLVTRAGSGGDHFLRISEPSSVLRGEWRAVVEDLGADDHSDSIFEATPIGYRPPLPSGPGPLFATPTGAMIDRRGDVDAFSINVEAGQIRAFICLPSPELRECHVTLYDATGTELSTASGRSEAWLGYEFEQAGTYIYAVSGPSSSTGAYTWRLENLGVDDHGDVPAAATPLPAIGAVGAPGSTAPPVIQQEARFELPNDRDVLALSTMPGHAYRISCTPTQAQEPAARCAIRLLDATGAALARSSTGTLEFEPPATGQAFVEFAPRSGFGPYRFMVEDVGLDDFGDDVATATPIMPGVVPQPGRIEIADDVDVMSFVAQPGGIFRLSCTSPAEGMTGCEAELLDGFGKPVGRGSGSTVYGKLAGGTHHVRISPRPRAAGTYQWLLEDLGVDDHGDRQSEATRVKSDSRGTANIEMPGDRDVLVFEAKARGMYRISCKEDRGVAGPGAGPGAMPGAAADCRMALRDSAGVDVVAWLDPIENDWWLKSADGGPIYLLISTSSSQVGSFRWRVEDLGTDDYADTPRDGTPLPVGQSFTEGELEMPGDIDYFKISLVAGHSYRVHGTGPVRATVYASDGITVIDSGKPPFTFISSCNGTCYLEVKGDGASARGDYSISVQP